jgi:hypothetical protein
VAGLASSVSDSVAGETAAAFSSYNLLKDEKRVHRRLPVGPTNIYAEPVTVFHYEVMAVRDHSGGDVAKLTSWLLHLAFLLIIIAIVNFIFRFV